MWPRTLGRRRRSSPWQAMRRSSMRGLLAAVRQGLAQAGRDIDIVLNDVDASACAYARLVVEANADHSSSSPGDTVVHTNMRASELLGLLGIAGIGEAPTVRPKQIHLDPFGTCEPYLRGALSAIDDGGILSFSFTVEPAASRCAP